MKINRNSLSTDFWTKAFRSRQKREETQLTFTCSKSTIETLEKGVKYVQS